MSKVVKTFRYGEHEFKLETGEIARQANGAVIASMGDTTVMVTVVARREGSDRDFFPLTVDYEERNYAAGRIPGGFFKREGRPSEKAILTCRLIDRPVRPLFPDAFKNEVQIVATVMSIDPEIDPDIVSMVGASAALHISGVPFQGPIGAARVGYVDNQYVLNPPKTAVGTETRLDLVVAGTSNAVLMVESEADSMTEEEMLGAVMYGHEQMQTAIQAIVELGNECGREEWDWTAPEVDTSIADRVRASIGDGLVNAYSIAEKSERQDAVGALRDQMLEAVNVDPENDIADEAKNAFQES